MNFYQPPFMGMPMNQGMYQQPVYPQFVYADVPGGQTEPSIVNQQSYIENILRLNLGKVITIYMNFEGSQWGSKVFKGILQAAGKDHIIIKDTQSETRFILLTIYLCYLSFDEKIEYEYPYHPRNSQ